MLTHRQCSLLTLSALCPAWTTRAICLVAALVSLMCDVLHAHSSSLPSLCDGRFSGAAANRSWAEASKQSLLKQHHLMSSVMSLFALNPLVLPAFPLAWLLTLSKKASSYTVVRTALYLAAVVWSQAIIWSIRSVTPACFAYAAYFSAHATILPAKWPLVRGWAGVVALLYALVEVCFYFQTLRRARRLQRRNAGPELSIARRWLTYRRVEQSSKFVRPMAMPHNCVYWKKFTPLRIHATSGTAASNTCTALTPSSACSEGSSSSCEESVTPSARYMDSELRPLQHAAPHPFAAVDGPRMPAEETHPLEFLKGWFYNIPLKHIKHDNLMVFFAESQPPHGAHACVCHPLATVYPVCSLFASLSVVVPACRLHGHAPA
jgi:hypothetical protein